MYEDSALPGRLQQDEEGKAVSEAGINQGGIHEYLAELEDIPGTRIFTAARARRGYHINRFAMSLIKSETRDRFRADEEAYVDDWPIGSEAKDALLRRDYNTLLGLGGNIYFLAKLISTDGVPFAEAVSSMTGMSFPEYQDMMRQGGRSPQGNRSIKGGY